ncbi:hypothetical protein KC640_03820, partial [Candidatus Dojkabacteria bacterium]|nr:hypothetical protein [Candidatus Dojkabacteria bacterium]
MKIDKRVPHRILIYNPRGVLPAGYLRSFGHINFRLAQEHLGSSAVVWDDKFGIYWAAGMGEGAEVATFLESEKAATNLMAKFDKQWYAARPFERYKVAT